MSVSTHRLGSGHLGVQEPASAFSGLKIRDGRFKKTPPGHLSDLDLLIAPCLTAPIKDVLDIGVSTGLATLDLQNLLVRQGHSPRMVGTDLFVDAHIVRFSRMLTVLTDPEGFPLQYEVGGATLRAWTRRLDYLTLAAIPQAVARRLVQKASRRLIREGRTRLISMQSPALYGTGIKIVENDIFVLTPEFVGRFDFIRAANILDEGYFSRESLAGAVSNIRLYCRAPGTQLLVVKSSERSQDGTLFQLEADGRFRVRARFGRGSEVEPIVLGA